MFPIRGVMIGENMSFVSLVRYVHGYPHRVSCGVWLWYGTVAESAVSAGAECSQVVIIDNLWQWNDVVARETKLIRQSANVWVSKRLREVDVGRLASDFFCLSIVIHLFELSRLRNSQYEMVFSSKGSFRSLVFFCYSYSLMSLAPFHEQRLRATMP